MKLFPVLPVLLLLAASGAHAGTPDLRAWTRAWTLSEGDPIACGQRLEASDVLTKQRKVTLNFDVPTVSGLRRRFSFPNVNGSSLWQRGDHLSFWVVRSRLKGETLARTSHGCFGYVRWLSFCERWIKDYTATLDGPDHLSLVIAEGSDYPVHCAYTAASN